MSDEQQAIPAEDNGTDTDFAEITPGEGGPDPDGESVIENLVGDKVQAAGEGRNIDAMLNVNLNVQVILGHSRMPISQLLELGRGSVVELDKKIGEPVDVVINDRLVARGDLVKLSGDRIGVTLTEIVKDYVSKH